MIKAFRLYYLENVFLCVFVYIFVFVFVFVFVSVSVFLSLFLFPPLENNLVSGRLIEQSTECACQPRSGPRHILATRANAMLAHLYFYCISMHRTHCINIYTLPLNSICVRFWPGDIVRANMYFQCILFYSFRPDIDLNLILYNIWPVCICIVFLFESGLFLMLVYLVSPYCI